MSEIFVLIRVSTKKQKEARQITRMLKIGIRKDNIIIEKESGKSTKRLKYHRLVKRLKKDDILYIENIDRLGRDYDTILEQWNLLTRQKGVTVKVLDTPLLDTDREFKDLTDKYIQDVLSLSQAYQADSEWQKIKSRQAQGIVAAKASGKVLGRPKSQITETEINVVHQYQNKDITLNTALNLLKLKKSAFYKLRNTINNL